MSRCDNVMTAETLRRSKLSDAEFEAEMLAGLPGLHLIAKPRSPKDADPLPLNSSPRKGAEL